MRRLRAGDFDIIRAEDLFLRVALSDGTVVEDVWCVPLFPMSRRDSFIALVKKEDHRLHHLGYIASLAECSDARRAAIARNIRQRFFLPRIDDVLWIERGRKRIERWQCVTDRGERTVEIRDPRGSVERFGRLVVALDTDGNRYVIPDFPSLPAPAQRLITRSLFS